MKKIKQLFSLKNEIKYSTFLINYVIGWLYVLLLSPYYFTTIRKASSALLIIFREDSFLYDSFMYIYVLFFFFVFLIHKYIIFCKRLNYLGMNRKFALLVVFIPVSFGFDFYLLLKTNSERKLLRND